MPVTLSTYSLKLSSSQSGDVRTQLSKMKHGELTVEEKAAIVKRLDESQKQEIVRKNLLLYVAQLQQEAQEKIDHIDFLRTEIRNRDMTGRDT